MTFREVTGTYGRGTPCTVLVADLPSGSHWYAVEGSRNVNHTHDEITNGVDVETLDDDESFTWPDGVADLDELEAAIEG